MTLDCEAYVRVLLQECNVGLDRSLLARADIRLVVIKVDVLHILRERLFVSHGCLRRRWWRRRWSIDRNPCRRGLGPSRTLRRQGVRGGLGRTDLFCPVGLNCADVVNTHVGRVGSLPCQRGRLPFINRLRARAQRRGRCCWWWRRRWWRWR